MTLCCIRDRIQPGTISLENKSYISSRSQEWMSGNVQWDWEPGYIASMYRLWTKSWVLSTIPSQPQVPLFPESFCGSVKGIILFLCVSLLSRPLALSFLHFPKSSTSHSLVFHFLKRRNYLLSSTTTLPCPYESWKYRQTLQVTFVTFKWKSIANTFSLSVTCF